MIKGFKQYNEEKSKSVVFTFGRFNPPTTGHEKLLIKVASLAIGNDYKIFASQSSDPKKNPLGYKEKVMLMRKIFPKHGRNIVYDKKIKNAIDALVYLYNAGYTKATMVVGADRISDFKSLLNKYNGVKARHGFYEFPDGISIVSAGERDPDADDVSGMSASKMRAAATEGDFQSFATGLPKSFGDKLAVFNLLRKRMGLKEMNNFRKHIELKTTSIRERYIAEEVFLVGDRFLNLNGETHTITERCTNYIIGSDEKKYFLNKIVEVKQDKDIKDKKGTQPAKYFAKDAEGDEMSKSTKSKRDAHFKKGAEKDDDDPSAYKPAPGDKGAKTKPSKHTKRFKDMFGEEVLNEATKFKNLYHSSTEKINRPSNKPMFFAIDIQHAAGDDSKGWYHNMIASGETAYVYEAKPKGKIAAYDDKKVQKMFEDNKVDFEEYVFELVANPSQSEILKMEGTKLLEKNKYIGLQYFDYDPRDFSKDLEAVVIFNPAKNTSGFKKIKASNESTNEDKNPIIDTEPAEVEEGVDDPAIFKAIFLAGGPGSGKSFTVGKTGLTALGFKIVNSDPAFEKAIEKAGGVMEPEFIFSPKGQEIRTKAKTLTAKQRDLYIQGRLGLVIDGTGKDFEKIKRQAEKLKAIGYDVAMILVNTDLETAVARDAKRDRTIGPKSVKKMWDEVQKNIGKFQAFFKQNFIIVDNSEGSNWQKATTSAYKQMAKFANAQPKNKIARDWIKKQLGESSTDNVQMLKLMRKAMSHMPGSPNQKKIIQQLNDLRKKNKLDPIPLKEDADVSLKKKAEKTGIPFSILKKVYNRGVAAWKTGHRPGTTPEQWGHARVNSFATKSKGTWGGADKDLAAKVK
jgi:shikimate kinase